MEILSRFIILGVPLVVAVVLHEVAHGYTAYRLGDPTAKDLGRLSLNPIRHVDPVMTLLLPAMLILSGSPIIFGGAKPVPVNFRRLRNPRRDMVLVALAGPAVNIVLAFLCALLVVWKGAALTAEPSFMTALMGQWLAYGFLINVVLALFNLIPIPPLDGGRIAVGLLPLRLARLLARVERFGFLILFALLFSRVLDPYLIYGSMFLQELLFGTACGLFGNCAR